MTEQSNDWQQRTPGFLSEFIAERCQQPRTEKWQQGPEFVARLIQCRCGSQTFHLKAAYHFQTKGFFRRKVVVDYLAPFFLVCTQCRVSRLLFDLDRHGWNGQDPELTPKPIDESGLIEETEAKQFMVSYSYQGESNYDELIADGVTNPEDFFDNFSLYARSHAEPGLSWSCINSYECA